MAEYRLITDIQLVRNLHDRQSFIKTRHNADLLWRKFFMMAVKTDIFIPAIAGQLRFIPGKIDYLSDLQNR
ncbi:hypothetical protein [Enterobacter sp. CPE_E1214]|uniref:hypothetical protein n=1 Tax=unclassified Enterobacter TaxID=2608935 RepID=UPI00388E438B